MTSGNEIRSAIEAATVPGPEVLERARMIVVDKLGEWDSLGVDELVESVCEAYEAPSGEPLRLADVDPDRPETDTPALRNLRYARAARTALVDLVADGTVEVVPPKVDDDDERRVVKDTTDAAAARAGADEIVLSTGPQAPGRRFALAAR